MTVQGIDHINIRAPKALVSELKEFYEDALGLRSGWRPPFESSGHWLYLGNAPIVHLVEDEAACRSQGPRGPVVDHVSFACAGLRGFAERLAAMRIPFRKAEVPGTSLVQLFLVDPAGNGVELQFADAGACQDFRV